MDDPTFVDTNVFLRFFVRDVESLFDVKHFKNIDLKLPSDTKSLDEMIAVS